MDAGIISQKEAAQILGVHSTRVRQFVLAGLLVPTKLARGGRPLFNAADIEALRKSRNTNPKAPEIPRAAPTVALKAFEMFDQKRSLREVVAVLDITPEKVRSLHREWATPLGGSCPKALPAVATFAELSERSEKESEAFASDFDREQTERKKKAERDHADRMHEHDEIRERLRERQR